VTEPASLVDDLTPRVWIGCMAHWADAIVGHWFDAIDAADVTLADVHRGSGLGHAGCEELWCYDIDNIPVDREMDPLEAAAWGRVHQDAGVDWPAVMAWVRSGCHQWHDDTDLPDLTAFRDRYCGRWDSFAAYAEQLGEEVGMMEGWPEQARTYFDRDAWTRDLSFDHVVVDAPGPEFGVFVFRSC